jgi:hypothetical protein
VAVVTSTNNESIMTLESLSLAYDLLVTRLDRELTQLQKSLNTITVECRARDESVDKLCGMRYDTFLATYVNGHEKELTTYITGHEKEHAAISKAADLALESLNFRLAGMNEFRQQMADTEVKYETKIEAGALESKLHTQINALSEKCRKLETDAITDRAKLIDKETVDVRIRALERLIYMAAGGMTIIIILANVLPLIIKNVKP